MRTKIQRWGHSLTLRIPKPFAIEARLDEKTEVDLTVTNGTLVITPTAKPPQRLEDLLSRVTKHNLHGQIDMGAPVGREAWSYGACAFQTAGTSYGSRSPRKPVTNKQGVGRLSCFHPQLTMGK
jgi:antitoxin MazE